MSGLLKTQVQLGDALDATKNFTLTSSAADGTMKLARGNDGATTQDVITVDAAGKVAFPQNAQTWQAFTVPTVRNLGAPYVNDTSQPIQVNVSAVSTTVGTMSAAVAGVTLRGSQVTAAGVRASIMFEVPAGATYQVDLVATASSINWVELR